VVHPRRKVLVVDDSAVARALLARRLESEGFDVTLSPSVAASSALDPEEISCALLDLDLGDGDGTEVAAALFALRPDLPVAFFSASVAADVVARASTMGPVFTKPDDLDSAVAWIRAHAE
jgi:DNA-binding response OmpR family regulator